MEGCRSPEGAGIEYYIQSSVRAVLLEGRHSASLHHRRHAGERSAVTRAQPIFPGYGVAEELDGRIGVVLQTDIKERRGDVVHWRHDERPRIKTVARIGD